MIQFFWVDFVVDSALAAIGLIADNLVFLGGAGFVGGGSIGLIANIVSALILGK